MLKRFLPLLLLSGLLLTAGCGTSQTADTRDGNLRITATTYPVYLLAGELCRDVPDVTLSVMIDQPVSCLHDYTLTMRDMKAMERSDVILLCGGGMEESMEAALEAVADVPQIDSSVGLPLMPSEEEEGEDDPHFWLDPVLVSGMLENLANGLAETDPAHAALYHSNAERAQEELLAAYDTMRDSLAALPCRELITFHDGFRYFADAFDLTILRSIEEDAGSEASAREVQEIVEMIEAHDLPAIFTEHNGSATTAEMISRETPVEVFSLNLMMSGDKENPCLDTYLTALQGNIDTILEAYE